MMRTDRPDGGPGAVVAAGAHAPAPPIRSGAELVAVCERFYHGIFAGALGFICLSTVTALAFLPLRSSSVDGRPPLPSVVAALAVLVLAALSIWHLRPVYFALRRHTSLQLGVVTIAAALLSVVSPLRNELWWPACAILMLLATVAPLRRALGYSGAVLAANLTAHAVSGDLPQTPTVDIVGLWIGIPFWTAVAALVPDRLASQILRINTLRPATITTPPRPVAACTGGPPDDEPPPADVDAVADTGPPTAAATALPAAVFAHPDRTSALTARQLEVVALLAAGHRYRAIAECLSISERQVDRHVRNAIARLNVSTPSELVTVAVAEGVLAAPEPEWARAGDAREGTASPPRPAAGR